VTVPFIDLKAQYDAIKQEIDRAIADVISRSEFVLGATVARFEAQMAAYCGCRWGVGVGSGTDALLLAMIAAGVGPGDEVITTPFTFVATASTITCCGAAPVFVDVEPATLNIDVEKIAAAITPRTKAIVPVHLFGHPSDMAPLLELAREHELIVIEDAAQAVGSRYLGQRVGALGVAGCLSFYPSKNLGAYGDGGMVVTNDDGMADRVDVRRRQGSRKKYHAEVLGLNSRLDAIQAAVLTAKLEHLDAWNQSRHDAAARYNNLLSGLPVEIPVERPYAYHVYHQYTIQVDRRDELAAYLASRGIASMVYYPVPVHRQRLYADESHKPLPVSEAASQRVLSLPMFAELTEAQQQEVVNAMREFFDGNS
jgi:dTDP-4-amino-4,6-dideoxygalactose transaminase